MIEATAIYSSGCASAERSMHDWVLKRLNKAVVLAEGAISRSRLDPQRSCLTLFILDKSDMIFHLQFPLVGERACSCLARPQEGGANIIDMRLDARSISLGILRFEKTPVMSYLRRPTHPLESARNKMGIIKASIL